MSASVRFEDVVAACASLASLPRAKQRAALAALGIPAADKPILLVDFAMRRFFQKKRGEPEDRLAWVFVNGAIGRREVLPWERGGMTHIIRASTPRPETFPPWILANAVEQFALTFGKPFPRELAGWIGQTAEALATYSGDPGTMDAVARLRAFARANPVRTKTRSAPSKRGRSAARASSARGR